MTLDHMLLNLSYLGFKILDRLEHNLGLNLFLQTTPPKWFVVLRMPGKGSPSAIQLKRKSKMCSDVSPGQDTEGSHGHWGRHRARGRGAGNGLAKGRVHPQLGTCVLSSFLSYNLGRRTPLALSVAQRQGTLVPFFLWHGHGTGS